MHEDPPLSRCPPCRELANSRLHKRTPVENLGAAAQDRLKQINRDDVDDV